MKIFIFAGRIHHWLKLRPIYAALKSNDHDVYWLIANNAINIDPSSEFLDEFIHIYDYIDLEALMAITQVPQLWHDFQMSEYVSSLSPFWGTFSLYEVCEVYVGMCGVIAKEKPDVVLGLHENNFWIKTIAYTCNNSNTPHYVFQEGLLRQLDQDTMRKQSSACEYSDKIFVWGQSAKEQYIDAGIPEEKIYISGPMHLDIWHTIRHDREKQIQYKNGFKRKFNIDNNAPLVVFAPPQSHQYKGNLIEDLRLVQNYCRENKLGLIVKFHPFDRINIDGLNTYTETDPLPLITAGDLLIIQHSTIGIEALALGVPIIELNLTNETIIQSWHKEGVAERIKNKKELEKISKVLTGQVSLDVNHMNQWINNKILCDGKATQRVLNYILSQDGNES